MKSRILSVLVKQWPVACDLCFVPAVSKSSVSHFAQLF